MIEQPRELVHRHIEGDAEVRPIMRDGLRRPTVHARLHGAADRVRTRLRSVLIRHVDVDAVQLRGEGVEAALDGRGDARNQTLAALDVRVVTYLDLHP